MSVDGTWDIKMNTPIGPQTGKLVLNAENGVLTGQMDQMGNISEIEDGTISEDGDLAWKIKVTRPMKITVDINAKYDGADKISGKAKLGFIGSADLEAVRA